MIRALVIVLFITVGIVAPILIPQIPHNRQLSNLEDSYALVTHPPSSKRIADFSEVGLLGGANGNHCDFLVGEIRQSDASDDEIRLHYSTQTCTSPSNSKYSLNAIIAFPSDESQDDPILRYEIADLVEKARRDHSTPTLYIVYFLDEGHDPDFDIRCY